MHHWHTFPDPDAVARAAADFLAEHVQDIVTERGICHLALPGGTSPAACLQLLAEMDLPWDHIHWYLGDERCLRVGDAERNDTMITNCLWSKAAVPPSNCHPIPAELGPVAAAAAYSEVLKGIERLDIALLGMGEDGHTASLFPDNPALALEDPAVPVFDAPKPPPERVSLSIPTLRAARERMVLITGEGKQQAVQAMRRGEELPINQIGALLCLADRSATEHTGV